ncbi:MAG TPA: trehalose-phosphatase [Noviherbaspirillum sp.]
MQHLLDTPAGRARLDQAVADRLLCAFDFDGTLAPLVSRPEEARLPEATREQLQALQRHVPVAIITGRAIADIAPRLGFKPDILIGNHGLEGVPGVHAAALAEEHQRVCKAWRLQLEELLSAEYPDPRIQVEDKTYSLSVHYRHAQAAQRAERELASLLAALDPAPRLVAGKCVFNVMPPGAGNKGSALLQTMEEIGALQALYAGDDVTDEDVFRLGHPSILAVRIEFSTRSAAPYFLKELMEMNALLHAVCARLSSCNARNWLRTPDHASN